MLPARDATIDRVWNDPFGRLMSRRPTWEPVDRETDDQWVGSFPVDIREDGDAFFVDAELPGLSRDQIDVMLQANVLTITAGAEMRGDQARRPLQQERRTGARRRVFRLSQAVDDQKIDARLENGVLHLTLPKREDMRPRRVELKS